MKPLLLNIVNGEDREYSRILLLLTLGFASGIFLATFKVAGETLFLTAFSAEADLPTAKIFTGLMGTVTALVFTSLQKQYRFQQVALYTIGLIGIVIIGLTTTVPYSDLSADALAHHKYAIFFTFILIGPASSIVILIFWSLFGRLFDLRAAKRLAGGIDTGTAIATIFAFFSIPFITPVVGHVGNFLYISALAITGVFIALFVIIRSFELTETIDKSGKTAADLKEKEQSSSVFKNRYLTLMSVFLISSMVAAIFMDYNFKIVMEQQYKDNENDLASFLSFFDGVTILLSFIVQSFFNDKILEIFGLKVTMILLPGLLLLFNVAILIIGSIFGIDPEGSMFLLFFLMIVISKILTDALRDSLENPTFKMFFLPLPTHIRFDAQNNVEGTVKEFAAFIAGSMMIALELLGFINVFQFIYFLFVIIAVWALSALRLFGEYKKVLKQVLSGNTLKKQSAAANNYTVNNLLSSYLSSDDPATQKFIILILDKTDPIYCEKVLTKFTSFKPDAQRYAIEVIRIQNYFDTLDELEHCAERSLYKDIRDQARTAMEQLKDLKREANKADALSSLATAKTPEERKLAAQIISQNYQDGALRILIPLLQDWDQSTRIQAIISCGQQQVMEPLPILIDHLSIVGYENVAISAIVKYGNKALPLLDLEFHKSGQSQNTMIDIIRIFGFIGGQEAINMLVRKFDFPDDKIRKEVLYSLNRCGWRAEGAMTAFVRSFIEREIENAIWNLAAIEELPSVIYCVPLRKALQEEVTNNYEELFLMLALLYDAKSVALVKENLELGTTESVGYAIELADSFIDDSLKPKLLPIIDDVPTSEKIKKLENFFPRDRYEPDQVLLNILNRSYSDIGRWSKACALYAMRYRNRRDVLDDVVACLFNPEEILREMAAWYIMSIYPDRLDQYLERIPYSEAKKLGRTAFRATEPDYQDDERLLLLEKVLFLYEVPLLNHVEGEMLISFAELMDEKNIKKGENISFDDAYLMPIIIIGAGTLEIWQGEEKKATLGRGEVVSDVFNRKWPFHEVVMKAGSDLRLYELDCNRFLEDMTDHYELSERIIQNTLRMMHQPAEPLNRQQPA